MKQQNQKLEQMKQEYEQIEIPKELKGQVEEAIKKAKQDKRKRKVFTFIPKTVGYGAVAAVLAITILSNSGEQVAYAMSKIPVIGAISKVVTFRTYENKEGTMEATINTPKVEGDHESIKNLNQKMEEYTETIKKQYEKDIKAMKEEYGDTENGHESVKTDYDILCDNEKLLSIRIHTIIEIGSSDSFSKCYTLDKQTGKILELSDLFQDGADYVAVLSQNIKEQMQEQMKEDESKSYFLSENEIASESFQMIQKNQNFYIDETGKLNIFFNKYEVAPGYMGECVFQIPTSVIQKIIKNMDWMK